MQLLKCLFNSESVNQFTAQARRAAEEASRSVQDATRTLKEASEDITYASKNTIEDLTKSAKQAATKGGLLKVKSLIDALLSHS